MENGQQEDSRTKRVEETAKQVPFEDHLDRALDQNKDQFYQNVLKQADEKIKSQSDQITSLMKQQVEFRDEVAVHCYVPLINEVSDYSKAAISAYQAADAFLRARESGLLLTSIEEEEKAK